MFHTGIGYDVHILKANLPLIIGGVLISSDMGCFSHTDGDALTHAIIDSLLGAAGKNDIGYYFPPTDNSLKGLSSVKLLERTMKIIEDFRIVNIDCVVILQSPSLFSYRDKIRTCLAGFCGISFEQINVKFKTEEHLGFTGSRNGIKALSTCLLEKNDSLCRK